MARCRCATCDRCVRLERKDRCFSDLLSAPYLPFVDWERWSLIKLPLLVNFGRREGFFVVAGAFPSEPIRTCFDCLLGVVAGDEKSQSWS